MRETTHEAHQRGRKTLARDILTALRHASTPQVALDYVTSICQRSLGEGDDYRKPPPHTFKPGPCDLCGSETEPALDWPKGYARCPYCKIVKPPE